MGKTLIRITESDLHRIIEHAVRSLIKEDDEDWKKSYDEWGKDLHISDPEKGQELHKKWVGALKKQYPQKKDRKKAFNNYMKEIDRRKGKKLEDDDDED